MYAHSAPHSYEKLEMAVGLTAHHGGIPATWVDVQGIAHRAWENSKAGMSRADLERQISNDLRAITGRIAPTQPRPRPQDEAGGASYALAYRDEK